MNAEGSMNSMESVIDAATLELAKDYRWQEILVDVELEDRGTEEKAHLVDCFTVVCFCLLNDDWVDHDLEPTTDYRMLFHDHFKNSQGTDGQWSGVRILVDKDGASWSYRREKPMTLHHQTNQELDDEIEKRLEAIRRENGQGISSEVSPKEAPPSSGNSKGGVMSFLSGLLAAPPSGRGFDYSIPIHISGLGIVFYSPFAVEHISEGDGYLESNFWEPADVARHVMDCTISAMGTGSPGDFVLRVYDGPYPDREAEKAMVAIRLGMEVRDSKLCFRDLYDFMSWHSECPSGQCIEVPDGFYRITVFTSTPSSGLLGDNQVINLHFERTEEKPLLKWGGVPDISEARR